MKRRNVLGAMGVMLVALPLWSRAQPGGRVYRIGFLGAASALAPVSARRVEAFRKGLRELGYIEGKNIIVDFRWAEGDANRLSELARQLIQLRVEVLVTQ